MYTQTQYQSTAKKILLNQEEIFVKKKIIQMLKQLRYV